MTKATSDRLRIIDMHTAGEPVRILLSGQLSLKGDTILEKRQYMKDHFDHIRTILMQEPRGHADMYGAILTEASDPTADIGVLFIHHSGYSTMCGHATIALGRYLYDEHLKAHPGQPRKKFRIECPCGPVDVRITLSNQGMPITEFDSVECFADGVTEVTEIEELGQVTYNIGYGGAYYAILPSSTLGLDFYKTSVTQLVQSAKKITNHLRKTRPITHPVEKDLSFLYGTILTDDIKPGDDAISYNLCLFGEGQIDRSPTGSGVCARMALYHHQGLLEDGLRPTFAGISGVPFNAEVCRISDHGLSITVSGAGYYLGHSEIIIENEDTLGQGFKLPQRFYDLMSS